MEELQTMPVDGESGPYRISENGGARRSAWSPDSEKIAFSDYDNQGRLQLFLAKRDGSERTQLTHFESSVDMMEISWSSDGQRIAAAYDSDGDDFQDAILTANTQGDLNPTIFEHKILWWWRDADSVFAGEPGDGLVLLDIHAGKVLGRWSTFGHLGHLIAPYQSDSDIGYFSSEGTFAVLDTVDNQITGFSSSSQPLADLAYWFESPATFLGEDECRSQ
jgi:dipeptidyl aminopeptidase/acylaminoacyl peptidase